MIEPWDYFLENTIQPPLPFQKWPNCNVQKLMQKQYFFYFSSKKIFIFFSFLRYGRFSKPDSETLTTDDRKPVG